MKAMRVLLLMTVCLWQGNQAVISNASLVSPGNRRYNYLRQLSGRQYEHNYHLPTISQRSSSKGHLFDWDQPMPSFETPPLPTVQSESYFKTQPKAVIPSDALKLKTYLTFEGNEKSQMDQVEEEVKEEEEEKEESIEELLQSEEKSEEKEEKEENIEELLQSDVNKQQTPIPEFLDLMTTTQHPVNKKFVDIKMNSVSYEMLDMSCLQTGSTEPVFAATPSILHGSVVSYRRRHNRYPPFNLFLEALFSCDDHYALQNPEHHSLYCQEGQWIGELPICIKDGYIQDDSISEEEFCSEYEASICDHICDFATGKPQCRCYRGFKLLEDGRTCEDIDECDFNNGGCEFLCHNQLGSYRCSCPQGYRLASNTKRCEDINECRLRNGHGPCQDGCTNTEGGYECSCNIYGTKLSSDNHTCEDIDECSNGNNGCSHGCLNSMGAAFCLCPEGYMLGKDWKTCEDINECEIQELAIVCSNQCINTVGSYKCGRVAELTLGQTQTVTCDEGFQADHSGTCIDIDECAENNYNCSHICINLHGYAECQCLLGYSLMADKKICEDLDECAENNFNCSHVCVNVLGSAECQCLLGYSLATDNKTCEDIDECATNILNCSHDCINTVGSANCQCPLGYSLMADNKTCEDIDECSTNALNCSHGCINVAGSAECHCPLGYSLMADRITCEDIDECSTNALNCSHGCINVAGSAKCQCPLGYSLLADNKTCEDIDECATNILNCSHDCINTVGSANCHCPLGYSLMADNKTCEDIDECSTNALNCSHGCINVAGSAKCQCPLGYSLLADSKTCEDIDECATNILNCSHDCINTVGSANCHCPLGYSLMADNKTCEDIDECSTNALNCSHGCINVAGSAKCQCPLGYSLLADNKTCEDTDECAMNNFGCSHICINVNGSAKCQCFLGYSLVANNKTCEDIDECAVGNFNCSHYCNNLNGAAECKCPLGYSLMANNKTCADVNECDMRNFNCSHVCINTDGSAECQCPLGYSLMADKKTCKDIDECSVKNFGCSHICINIAGSAECQCPLGYSLMANKKTCEVSKCSNNTFYSNETRKCEDCPLYSHLRGSIGNSKNDCICDEGFEKDDLSDCQDINECLIKNGGCNQDCINTRGNYFCSCSDNFFLAEDQRTCKAHVCPPLLPPENGNVYCKNASNSHQYYAVGSQCEIICNKGYKLNGESTKICSENGRWMKKGSKCIPTACPRLEQPSNGYILPPSCVDGKSLVGHHCYYTCQVGYTLTGVSIRTCKGHMGWMPSFPSSCRKEIPVPFIQCPKDILVELQPHQSKSHVRIAPIKTNMDRRYISVYPSWAAQMEGDFPAGTTRIQFTAKSPVSNTTASCILSVTVLDKEPPTVSGCPYSFNVQIPVGQAKIEVTWPEPKFHDNVNITALWKSQVPGITFPQGTHLITYIARDAAGNKAHCTFNVYVKAMAGSRAANLFYQKEKKSLKYPQVTFYRSKYGNEGTFLRRCINNSHKVKLSDSRKTNSVPFTETQVSSTSGDLHFYKKIKQNSLQNCPDCFQKD